MFNKLQKKWKVNGTQLFLVLCVFAIGGSLTGFFGKIIMNRLPIERGLIWTLVYIIVVTLIWPLNVLLVSIPFGQLPFFSQYLRRMGTGIGLIKKQRLPDHHMRTPEVAARALKTGNTSKLIRLAVFASGTGSNTQKIIDYFRDHQLIRVGMIACNKPEAGVLNIAAKENLHVLMIDKETFFRGNAYVDELRTAHIDFIVLAGFLWKIPRPLIDAYRNKIINIHPALLPKHGGKGMYGNKVHEAVINAGDEESGITIHYVDEHYDNGDIIFQAKVSVMDDETPESLALKIHQLEHSSYPPVLEALILKPNGR